VATTDGLIDSSHEWESLVGGARQGGRSDGQRRPACIDGVASTWSNVHGQGHPAIERVIHAQLQSTVVDEPGDLDRPATELARRLATLAPAGLDRVLYADSGPAAVQSAIELARRACRRRGDEQRTHVIRSPVADGRDLEARLHVSGDRVAALVIEPLVRASAGMRLQTDGLLRRARELCEPDGVLLICDETATAFGRTGAMFACEHERVAPDLLCVAGGLTSHGLPLAATLAGAQIHASADPGIRPSRAPDPVACAAAIATLKAFEREHTLALLAPKIELLAALLERRVAVLPGVGEVRQVGMMVGIELLAPDHGLVSRAVLAARRRRAAIGSCGDVIVLTPALAITDDDLRRLVAITASSIAEAYVGRLPGARVTLRRA
jgi:adenosylmethionine---8-amino-7-oxononanoate aminotransferase